MEHETQRGTSDHLSELAVAELGVANDQLAEAGRAIEELRADALSLATRIDAARAETEQVSQEKADLASQLVQAQAENDQLRAEAEKLKSHIARLKDQLSNPARLMVKKALRRGQYAKPSDS